MSDNTQTYTVGPDEWPMYEKDVPLPVEKKLSDTASDLPQGAGSRLDSDTVDGVQVARTPTPNALIPLNSAAQLAASTVPFYYASKTVGPTGSTTTGTFTVTLAAFEPDLPSTTTRVGFIYAFPTYIEGAKSGGAGASNWSFSQVAGGTFNGTTLATGIYKNVAINDTIDFTISLSGADVSTHKIIWTLIAVP